MEEITFTKVTFNNETQTNETTTFTLKEVMKLAVLKNESEIKAVWKEINDKDSYKLTVLCFNSSKATGNKNIFVNYLFRLYTPWA